MRLTILRAVVVAVVAAAVQAAPSPPGLQLLFSANITMSHFVEIGEGVRNTTRDVLPISGGQFIGPKMTGKVLMLGQQWLDYDSTKWFITDSGIYLHTHDNVDVYMNMRGQSVADGGSAILNAKFQTGAANYSWLNDVQAVGIARPAVLGYALDIWQVTSPTTDK